MSFHPNVWNQLKNITCEELIKALKKDDWQQDTTSGAVQAYKKGQRRYCPLPPRQDLRRKIAEGAD